MFENQYKSSILIVALLVLMVLFNVNVVTEMVLEEDIQIISKTFITVDDAKAWAKEKGATEEFIGLAKIYWELAEQRGSINPALAYVQAAKETGYGNFKGVLDASYKNPCGLKTTKGGGDKEPSAHKRFTSWKEGIAAHLDHLALYAGAKSYPRKDTGDPRHFTSIYGKATTAVALGANWAPNPNYGEEVMRLYNNLLESSKSGDIISVGLF